MRISDTIKRLKIPGFAHYWHICLLVSHLFLGTHNLQAQNRPVSTTMVFSPPYTLSLADYSSATAQKLRLTLLLRDLGSPLRPVKLRFTIQGSGLTIRTRESFLRSASPLPINLVANVPTQLSGINESFRQYFNPGNMDVLGLDRNQFLRSKSLPSGIYRWQVEVLDYNLLLPLNNAQHSTQTLWMVKAQPPIVNLPLQNQKLRATNYGLQNVTFQWLNRAASSPNSAFTTQYQVFLYEVYEPNNAQASNARSAPRTLVFRNTLPLTNTTLIYNNTFPALTPGKRYIFQVQAQDSEGRDLFENRGFSQTVVFQYGDECLPPTGIKAESSNTESIRLSWQSVPGSHTAYRVRYRRVGGQDWTETTSQFNDLTINRLAVNQEYEYEVSSICGQLDGTNWARGTVKTRAPNPQNFVCGTPQGTYDLSNAEPLGLLNPGDEILVGGYRVKIRRATGGNGQFSGVGIAQVPLGNTLVKLKVGFSNIFVNADHRMLQGQIYAVRNKWKAMHFATRLPVDQWQITQEGKVEIKTNGRWKRLPVDGRKDYMLLDQRTKKQLFVDRNGRPDIPLEDRDYSKLSPQEVVAAAKKLQQEADEAIKDGRYGDALKLAAEAEKLFNSVKDKVKKVVGFGKLVLKVVKEIVREKRDTLKKSSQKAKAQNKELTNLARKINDRKSIASGQGQGQLGARIVITSADKDQSSVSEERKNQLLALSDNFKAYDQKHRKLGKQLNLLREQFLPVLLIEIYLGNQPLEQLVIQIKKELPKVFQKYEALKDKNATSEIEQELKQFMLKLIEQQRQKLIKKK